jgi:hypothetical protein
MRLTQNTGVTAPYWFTAGLVRNDDINYLSYTRYQLATDLLVGLSRAKTGETIQYVLGGLRLIPDNLMTVKLEAGAAVSFDGEYIEDETRNFEFVAESGAPFSVLLQSDSLIGISPADGAQDRVDTIQVRPLKTIYDVQTRKFRDPATGTVSSKQVETKVRYNAEIQVVEGALGTGAAPAATAGWIKIAEVSVPAGTSTITSSFIKTYEQSDEWTTEIESTLPTQIRAADTTIEDVAANLDSDNVEDALAEIFQKLGSTDNGEGASIIGIEDLASYFSSYNVEGALVELFEKTSFPSLTVTGGGSFGSDLDLSADLLITGNIEWANGEITSDDSNSGARVIARAKSNPASGDPIFAVESSGSATRFGVTQDYGSFVRDALRVGYTHDDGVLSAPSYVLDVNGNARIIGTGEVTGSSAPLIVQESGGGQLLLGGNEIDHPTGILYLQTNSNNDLQMIGGGRVGIGKSPTAKLDVFGTIRGNSVITYDLNSISGTLLIQTNTQDVRMVTGGGRVGVDTAAPQEKLDVGGNIRVSGNIILPSGANWIGYSDSQADPNIEFEAGGIEITGGGVIIGSGSPPAGGLRVNGNLDAWQGVDITNPSGEGVRADNCDSYGFRATNNGGHGFVAESHSLNTGFVSRTNFTGFNANNNAVDGFLSSSNSQDGFTSVSNDGWGFYASSNGDGAYGPFTGAHDGLIDQMAEIEVGDIVCDSDRYYTSGIDDSMTINYRSQRPYSPNVIGVLQSRKRDYDFARIAVFRGKSEEELMELQGIYDHITINGVGEGVINVCGENGDMKGGDLVVSSSQPGKGMRQEDNVVRNYTVARVRVNVQFDSAEDVKQVPCIYLAG